MFGYKRLEVVDNNISMLMPKAFSEVNIKINNFDVYFYFNPIIFNKFS